MYIFELYAIHNTYILYYTGIYIISGDTILRAIRFVLCTRSHLVYGLEQKIIIRRAEKKRALLRSRSIKIYSSV